MNQEGVPTAVWFPQWAEVPGRLRLPARHRQQYRSAIISYLRYGQRSHQRATVSAQKPALNALGFLLWEALGV